MKKLISFLFVIVSFSVFAQTQNYPVLVNLELIAPYPLNIETYTSPFDPHIAVNLNFKDITQGDIEIYLKFCIKGDNITINTTSDASRPVYHISGGQYMRIAAEELAWYFNRQNLAYQGQGRDKFYQTGSLPEGIYDFSVEVWEVSRNVQVSNTYHAVAYILLNDPPVWTLPNPLPATKGLDVINASYPNNIFFSWSISNASLNAAFTTEYEFLIVEIPSEYNATSAIADYEAMEFSYKFTLQQTNYLYGAMDPQLVAGKNYACQIRAYDTGGRNLYKNDGKSEILSFKYGLSCPSPSPLEVNTNSITAWDANVKWTFDPTQHTSFNIEYREVSEHGQNEWFSSSSSIDSVKLQQLNFSTKYEFKVQGVCGSIPSEYSKNETFVTKSPKREMVECTNGKVPEIIPGNPKSGLSPGDTIRVGGFYAIVSSVSGSNGVFTGECYVLVPTMGMAVEATFTNLYVNEHAQITDGVITVNHASMSFKGSTVAQNWGSSIKKNESEILASPDVYIKDLQSLIAQAKSNKPIPQYMVVALTEANTKINTIIENNAKGLGAAKSLSTEQVEAMKSSSAEISKLEDKLKQAIQQLQLVLFKENEKQSYGFDQFKYQALKSNYETKIIDNNEYIISWKATKAGGDNSGDIVDAYYKTKDNKTPEVAVDFKSSSGATPVYIANKNGETQTLTLLGKTNGMEELITAYIKDGDTEKELGYLNQVSYAEVVKELVVIPVTITQNGSTVFTAQSPDAGSLQKALNDIYAQAVVKWEVEVADAFTIDRSKYDFDNNNTIDCGTGFLNSYTDETNAIVNQYKKQQGYITRKYYIFLVDASTQGYQGFMPVGGKQGLVFTGAAAPSFRTIAHELGHGAFTLRHTFSDYPSMTIGTIDNLMDYSSGTKLCKYQWDRIHKPINVVLETDDEEEAVIAQIFKTTVWVDDSIMSNNKVVINSNHSRKLIFQLDYKDEVKARIEAMSISENATTNEVVASSNETSKIVLPYSKTYSVNDLSMYRNDSIFVDVSIKICSRSFSNDNIKTCISRTDGAVYLTSKILLGQKTEFNLDSLPEGKYTLWFNNDSLNFYIRDKKYDYACVVCGRDLTITRDILEIVGGKKQIFDDKDAKFMTKCLQAAGFTNCKSQAHFLSQCASESGGFQIFLESSSWSLNTFYKDHLWENNCNIKFMFSQDFWDNKTYKEYFSIPYIEKSTDTTLTNKKIIKTSNEYTWRAKNNPNDLTFTSCLSIPLTNDGSQKIKIPWTFESASSMDSVFYVSYSLTKQEKEDCKKKLYNALYATFLGNGGADTDDGSTYKGKGMIQLTGKGNFKDVSDVCNRIFYKTGVINYKVDLVEDIDKVSTDHELIILSGIGYILYRKDALSVFHTGNCKAATLKVNSGAGNYKEVADPDINRYTRLHLFKLCRDEIFYDCNITENE